MRLSGRLLAVSDLSVADRDSMLDLMQRHYVQVEPSRFLADLAEKHWVIQVIDPSTNRLCGFSTQMLLEVAVDGRRIHSLFSGDTIVDRRHWGDPVLSHVWGRLALSLIDQLRGRELYWFLISQGYRTYRFLPVFFRAFYPRTATETPRSMKQILDALAGHKFAERYDSELGIVRANADHYRLRNDLAEVTSGRRNDPHVDYFLRRNSGHSNGDELCCLAPLT